MKMLQQDDEIDMKRIFMFWKLKEKNKTKANKTEELL